MKNKTALNTLFSATVLLSASSLFAGNGGSNFYWTRGYDGTIEGTTASTTNNMFGEDGKFTERLVQTGTNVNIYQVDTKTDFIDPTTGARTETAVTPDVTTTGSLYLHIGYINSGFTGAGSSVDVINMNGDLTIGRLGFENAYERPSGTWHATSNMATVLTTGAENHTLTFDYQGDQTNLQFVRRGGVDFGANLQLDCNIVVQNYKSTGTATSVSLFNSSNSCDLILGSDTKNGGYARTITLKNNHQSVGENMVMGTTNSKVTVYSNVVWNGVVKHLYRGTADYYIHGNTTVNHNIAGTTRVILLSGGRASTANFYGNITVDGIASSANNNYFWVFHLNNAGQNLTMKGDVNFKSFGYAETAGVKVYSSVVYFEAPGTNTVIDGAVNVSGAVTRGFALYNARATGNITFNGAINLTATGDSEQILGTAVAGATINFVGKIDSSTRSAQTSFQGNAAAIINFKGKEDNTLHNIGLRTSVYNLMNTNGAAIKASSYISFGNNARVNIFGDDQLNVGSNSNWSLWGPNASRLSATVNMNGKKSLRMGKFNPANSGSGEDTTCNRWMIIDFGMSDSGMTDEQMTAQGITADMVNKTGAGVAQTFVLGDVNFASAARVSNCYILFKNYIVGEDSIICEKQLSTTTKNGDLCYSKTDINGNILRIDGFTDAAEYGVDYWLEETALIDGTWQYSIVVVPETSTIAVIFGSLVLAFAIYRRKKNA